MPAVPSNNDEAEDSSDKENCTVLFEGPAKRVGAPRYNLRNVPRVHYSSPALPDVISTGDEPTLREALASPESKEWNEAIHEEFTTLDKNGSWKGIPPPNARSVPSGIILKLKRNAKGRSARCKACLVARGSFQNDFIDRAELYTPVASIELVRTLVCVAVAKN